MKKTFPKANQELMGKAKEQMRYSQERLIRDMKILPDLQKLIPALAYEEYEQLKMNIQAEGCREPLIVWVTEEDDVILIDGHNRHKICLELGTDFRVEASEFDNLEDVMDWMVNNQLGKRNVSDNQKSYLRGTQYKLEKYKTGKAVIHFPVKEKKGEEQEEPKKTRNRKSKKHLRTTERLAEKYKVSPKTIERDEKFAIGLDRLTDGDHDLKSKILNKEIPITKSVIEGLATKPVAEVLRVRGILETGNYSMLSDDAKPLPVPMVVVEEEPTYKSILKKLTIALQTKNKDEAKLLLQSLSETIDNL